jgi:hypothetical protein
MLTHDTELRHWIQHIEGLGKEREDIVCVVLVATTVAVPLGNGASDKLPGVLAKLHRVAKRAKAVGPERRTSSRLQLDHGGAAIEEKNESIKLFKYDTQKLQLST